MTENSEFNLTRVNEVAIMASSIGVYKYPMPTVDFVHCPIVHNELVDVMVGFDRNSQGASF